MAIPSQCSPMLNPVDGSTIAGESGRKSRGRNRATCRKRSPMLREPARSTKVPLARRVNRIGGFDMESTPPAMPTSQSPRAIALATVSIAVRPVMQLSDTEIARTLDSRRLANTTSRAKWGSLGSGTTIPKARRSTLPASMAVLASTASTACTASSNAPRCVKALRAFTNGVRMPPTTATRCSRPRATAVTIARSSRRMAGCCPAGSSRSWRPLAGWGRDDSIPCDTPTW